MKAVQVSRTTLFISIAALCILNLGYGQATESELEQIITTLEGSDYEARHEARMALQAHVSDASIAGKTNELVALEKQLLHYLSQNYQNTTRIWILRQIAAIGSDASVDTLAETLQDNDEHVADASRMALEVNPSPRALPVLLQGLLKSKEERSILGFIIALGNRKYGDAVPAIAPYLENSNSELVDTAALALGKVGTSDAKTALLNQYTTTSNKVAIELALLQYDNDFEFLSDLARNGANASIRVSAFQQCISKSPSKANKLLQNVLSNADADETNEIIRAAMNSGKAPLTRTVLNNMETFSPEKQAIVLGSLENGKSSKLERTVLAIAQTEDETLKAQAVEALGRIGSFRSLPLLMEGVESKSRILSETAIDALSLINDPKIDRFILGQAKNGSDAERISALEALSYRASDGAPALINRVAADASNSVEVREAALAAMEEIGTDDSFEVLVDIIVDAAEPKLQKTAQRTLKRMSLRTANPEKAWKAFRAGFEKANGNEEATLALLAILDSAPTSESIDYIKQAWNDNDESIQKTILRILPLWRTWDGGFALLDIAKNSESSEEDIKECYKGIGRLILGSDATYSLEGKYDLASAALRQTASPDKRKEVMSGFRYSNWRDRVHVTNNEVDPELREAVLEFAKD